MTDHSDIEGMALALSRWERAERERLLEGFSVERDKRRRALFKACGSIGHGFKPLPDNGINGPSLANGEWPEACSHCWMRKPRKATDD